MTVKTLNETIKRFPDLSIEKFIIMPNHIHCIIGAKRADTRSATTVCDFVRAFKSETTVEYIRGVKPGEFLQFNKRIWQRNYYEHIIRNNNDYNSVWQYIDENPSRWAEDRYYN